MAKARKANGQFKKGHGKIRKSRRHRAKGRHRR